SPPVVDEAEQELNETAWKPWQLRAEYGTGWTEPNLRVNMSAAVWVFILTFSTLNGVISGDLRSPTNVQLSSRNLNLMLTWEPPAGAPSGLVYSTQYT
ncbi:hypothetical protein CHARACLAT_030373, partial [Characodon lateralis]|nr:hypothetical protein [Characodon lateralis]